MNRSAHQSLVGLLLLLAVAIWTTLLGRPEATGILTLAVLDVGQGDGLLLTTPLGRQVVIDAGPSDTVIHQLDRVLPLTRRRIDLVVLSHNHSDHIGGAAGVLKRYPVEQLWMSGAVHTTATYLDFLQTAKSRSVPTTVVAAGDGITLDGVRLNVLYPLTSQRDQRPDNQHDASVVVLVEFGERSFLLTGDLESEHEAQILASGQLTHPVDVLKVGHHGSNTSTSEAWLDALKPSVALISVGTDNKFGHPHAIVLERLQQRGIAVYRTDEHGTIRVTTDGMHLWTETER